MSCRREATGRLAASRRSLSLTPDADYFAKEFDQADDKKKSLERSISDLETAIADAKEGIATVTEEIAALTAAIKSLDKAVAEAKVWLKRKHCVGVPLPPIP